MRADAAKDYSDPSHSGVANHIVKDLPENACDGE
jgi:hypothetical protein